MKHLRALLLLAVCFSFLGTTYVVKEGGREVGRYDENDGKTETVELNNDVPKQTPRPRASAAPVKTPLPGAKKTDVPADAKSAEMNELFRVAQAKAEQLSAEAKKKNDKRRAESEEAIKEMETGYKKEQ